MGILDSVADWHSVLNCPCRTQTNIGFFYWEQQDLIKSVSAFYFVRTPVTCNVTLGVSPALAVEWGTFRQSNVTQSPARQFCHV